MAPDEDVSLSDLPVEEVDVLARHALGSEGLRLICEQLPFEQRVASPALVAVEAHPGGIQWSLVNPALDDPLRRVLFEIGLNGAQHAINAVFPQRLEEVQQPSP